MTLVAALYLAAKALHAAAVVAWLAGTVLVAVLLGALRALPAAHFPADRALLLAVRRWDRHVTTPAMGIAWALGLWLAWRGGFLGAGWLSAKLGLVVALSALHGMLSGSLRRTVGAEAPLRAGWVRWAAPGILAAAALIVALVVGKPF